MPPDACLRRRNPAALKPPRFPILAFDERELRLALGSVFNLKWLVPGESLVSILWKFFCAKVDRIKRVTARTSKHRAEAPLR